MNLAGTGEKNWQSIENNMRKYDIILIFNALLCRVA
jgi:hypothetical protein